jgi:spore photoproduct lyase
MKTPESYITRLLIDEDCYDLPYTREIITNANLPVEIISSENKKHKTIPISFSHSLSQGKKSLLLCQNKGRFFKACPATREYQCCKYQVLNIGMNCPMDCIYCILQAYLNNPWLSFFVNIEKLFSELDAELSGNRTSFYRIGTGEFTDSLAIDNFTGLSRKLIEYFSRQSNCILELKTKTANINKLYNIDHGHRTLVSWSLNSEYIMEGELRTATLEQRLHAASECAGMGYHLGFHFDPVVFHENWKQQYKETIRRLFSSVPADKIVWISIGALRYLPSLKKIALNRFPGAHYFKEEFVLGLDQKYRYFRKLRVELYQLMVSELKKYSDSDTCIYFCMESPEIWQEVFGYTPEEYGGLPAMLDRVAKLKINQG